MIMNFDLGEMRAVEKALDALPYGNMDPRAKEVEAQAIADYRKAKAEREGLEKEQKH